MIKIEIPTPQTLPDTRRGSRTSERREGMAVSCHLRGRPFNTLRRSISVPFNHVTLRHGKSVIVLGTNVADLSQLAPDEQRVHEQTEKIEEGLSPKSQDDGRLRQRKLVLEDYVFFAEAQRASDREYNGIM